jgi:hypothetical protein
MSSAPSARSTTIAACTSSLVRDVADDRLDQVLDRQQAIDAAVFVDHQRQVHALLAHLKQQVEHRYLRRHHQRAAQDRLSENASGRPT